MMWTIFSEYCRVQRPNAAEAVVLQLFAVSLCDHYCTSWDLQHNVSSQSSVPSVPFLLVRFDCCVCPCVCVQDHSTLLVVCFCLSCPRVTPDPKLVSPHKFSFFARCQSIKRIFYSSVCLVFGAQRLTTASHPYLLLSP